jgi:hypothetical protein
VDVVVGEGAEVARVLGVAREVEHAHAGPSTARVARAVGEKKRSRVVDAQRVGGGERPAPALDLARPVHVAQVDDVEPGAGFGGHVGVVLVGLDLAPCARRAGNESDIARMERVGDLHYRQSLRGSGEGEPASFR